MFLFEMRQALKRRWYLLVVGVFAAAGMGVSTFQALGPSYDAVSETLLLPPSSILPAGGNPYLQLGDLTAAVDVLAKAVSEPSVLRTLKQQGLDAQYLVERDQNSPAPMVLVTINAKTAADALRAKDLVQGQIPTSLRQLQERDGIPPARQITSTVVMNPDEALPSHKTQIRVALALAIAAALLFFILTAAVDALLMYPRRRKAREQTADGEPRDGEPHAGEPRDEDPRDEAGTSPASEADQDGTDAVSTSATGKRDDNERKPRGPAPRPKRQPAPVDGTYAASPYEQERDEDRDEDRGEDRTASKEVTMTP